MPTISYSVWIQYGGRQPPEPPPRFLRLCREYELKLLEQHKDKWTSFQYKLWAEMLACGTHTSLLVSHLALQCLVGNLNTLQIKHIRAKPSALSQNPCQLLTRMRRCTRVILSTRARNTNFILATTPSAFRRWAW